MTRQNDSNNKDIDNDDEDESTDNDDNHYNNDNDDNILELKSSGMVATLALILGSIWLQHRKQ